MVLNKVGFSLKQISEELDDLAISTISHVKCDVEKRAKENQDITQEKDYDALLAEATLSIERLTMDDIPYAGLAVSNPTAGLAMSNPTAGLISGSASEIPQR